jgi:hypothetical protein
VVLGVAAPPPDVGKVYDLPENNLKFLGLCPVLEVWGVAPMNLQSKSRKVIDLPHIGRQSRKL